MGLVESSQNRSFPWGPAKSRSTQQFSGNRGYDVKARQAATLPGRARGSDIGPRAAGSFRCQDLLACQSEEEAHLNGSVHSPHPSGRRNSNKRKSDPLSCYFGKSGCDGVVENGNTVLDDSLTKCYLSHSDESLCARDENDAGYDYRKPYFRTSISFPCNGISNDDSEIVICEEKQTQTSPPSTMNKMSNKPASEIWSPHDTRSGRSKNRGRSSNKLSTSMPANPRSQPYCGLHYEDLLPSAELSKKEEENLNNSLSRASLYINGDKNIVIPTSEKTQVFIKCNTPGNGINNLNKFKGVQVSPNVWFESNIPQSKRKTRRLLRKQSSESNLTNAVQAATNNTKNTHITELPWIFIRDNDTRRSKVSATVPTEKCSPVEPNSDDKFNNGKTVSPCLPRDGHATSIANTRKDSVSEEKISRIVPSRISEDNMPCLTSPAPNNVDANIKQNTGYELAPVLGHKTEDKLYLHVENGASDWGTFPVLRLPKLEGQPYLIDILGSDISADDVGMSQLCDAEKYATLPNSLKKENIPYADASPREDNSPVGANEQKGRQISDLVSASSDINPPECTVNQQLKCSGQNGCPEEIVNPSVCACLDSYASDNKNSIPIYRNELPSSKDLHSPEKDCGFTCHEQCQDVVSIDCKIALPELIAGGVELSEDEAEQLSRATPTNSEDATDNESETDEKHEEELQEKDLAYCEVADNEQISTLRRTVCRIQSQMVASSEIEEWVEKYSSANQGLQIAKEKDGSYRGCLRIHLNLSRPINIVAGTRPPSIYDILQEDRTMEKTLTSFYMPRDAVKAIHITSKTTTREVIIALLKKFKVVDNPQKFALYEKTYDAGQSIKAKLHRLGDNECPLVLAIAWGAQSLTNKRLVLQENDTADIQWDAFSLPELYNFLRILDKEEAEYKNQIRDKYGLLRKRINGYLTVSKS